MRRTLFLFFLLFFLPYVSIFSADVTGTWKRINPETSQASSLVKIWIENGRIYGKVEEVFVAPGEDPNPVCTKCTGSRRGQKVRGMTIIWGLQDDGESWDNGKMINLENGKLYDCRVELLTGGRMIEVRGYSMFSLFGSSEVWLRHN